MLIEIVENFYTLFYKHLFRKLFAINKIKKSMSFLLILLINYIL